MAENISLARMPAGPLERVWVAQRFADSRLKAKCGRQSSGALISPIDFVSHRSPLLSHN